MSMEFAKGKKRMEFAIQLIAWAIILSAPIFFRPPVDVPTRATSFFMIVPSLFLAAFYFGNYYLFIPQILFRKRIVPYVLVIFACTLTIIFLPELMKKFSSGYFPSVPPAIRELGRLSSTVFFLLTFVISSSIAVIKELFETWDKKQRAEAEKVEAELASLRLQVNPHFLFNTLYNIYYLSANKSDNAPGAILKLSDMMRFLMTDSQEKYIPLRKEVNYIQRYIDLQKMRISEKTTVRFAIVGDSSSRQIAPLLLFPFVENAFKYGVSSHEETSIYIGLLVSDTMIQFEVTNQKFQTVDESGKNNIGLKNVTNRLQLIYPRMHKLEIMNEKKNFNVHLRIFYSEEHCVYNFL